MRMLHVLRKPLSEGTVASNVLKHGTGGLNIDASRIDSPGETITTHSQSKKAANTRTIFDAGTEKGWAGIDTNQTEGQKLGRWPANVILQHLDGCRCEVCEPGCPVARLDADSLAGGMPSPGSSRSAKREAGKTGMFPMDGDGHRFGDRGGASRFFKQIGGKADG